MLVFGAGKGSRGIRFVFCDELTKVSFWASGGQVAGLDLGSWPWAGQAGGKSGCSAGPAGMRKSQCVWLERKSWFPSELDPRWIHHSHWLRCAGQLQITLAEHNKNWFGYVEYKIVTACIRISW